MLPTIITAVFATYNCLGEKNEVMNGWHEANGRRALVLQNSRGFRLGGADANQPNDRQTSDWRTRNQDGYYDRTDEEISNLWEKVEPTLSEADYVVVYIGSGSDRILECAVKLPSDRVTFVGCNCQLDRKLQILGGSRYARMFSCECGGHDRMKLLFEEFMETGKIAGRVVRPTALTYLGSGI